MGVHVLLFIGLCVGIVEWTRFAGATPDLRPTYEPVRFELFDDLDVKICNTTHLCSTRPNPCVDGPILESLACYCDPLCSSFGDCCVDYEETCLSSIYTESATVLSSSTQTLVTEFDEKVHLEVDKYTCNTLSHVHPNHKLGFWVISQCSADVTKDSKCSDQFSYPTRTLEDMAFRWLYVPVTSANTGLAYKNVYCALCNGEQGEFHYWRVKLMGGTNNTWAPSDQSLESKLYLYMSNYDDVTWYPPQYVNTNVVRSCIEYQEQLCLRENLRENGINKCAEVTAIVQFNDKTFRKAICSGCSDYVTGKLKCSEKFPYSIHRGPDQEKMGGNTGLDLLPISVLIDFTGSTKQFLNSESQMLVSTKCAPDEVYNPQSRKCIKLSCSPGLILNDNECVPAEAAAMNTHCTQNMQEWSFELYSHDELSCDVKINEIFKCLYQANIFVTIKEILQISFSGNRCRSSLSVDVSKIPNNLNLFEALRSFMDIEQSPFHSDIDDGCVILNPLFYTSCKSALEERCIGRLYPFPTNESHLIRLEDKRFHYINDTKKFYPEEMALMQVTYDEDRSLKSTLLVCDGTPLKCPYVTLNKSLFMNVDSTPGFIEYKPTGRIISPDMYLLASSDLIQVCSFFDNEGSHNATSTVTLVTFSLNQTIVSTTCCCISLISLLLTFFTYAKFSILHRSLSNKLIMCLCVAIFMGQLMLLLIGQANHNLILCTAIAALTHYIWLVAFAFTFSLAYDLHRTFGSNSISPSSEDGAKILLLYFSNSLGTPLLIVIACLVIQFQRGLPVIYARDGICWLSGFMPMILSFGAPIAITLSLNCVLFVNTVTCIFRAKRLSRKILWHDLRKPSYAENLKELFIYFKISTLMGFTWITGFIANYVKTDVMWYVFVILNALQGAFIFFAFMCNRRVWRLWTQVKTPKSTTTSFKKSWEVDGHAGTMAKNKIEYNANGHDMKTIDRMVERVTRM